MRFKQGDWVIWNEEAYKKIDGDLDLLSRNIARYGRGPFQVREITDKIFLNCGWKGWPEYMEEFSIPFCRLPCLRFPL